MHRLSLFLLIAGSLMAEDSVLDRVTAHAARFGEISRAIWESPELGFHEQKSSALLREELRKNGFSIQDGVAGMPTAFVASWGSGKPVIAVLGEFDALPGLSQKDQPKQEPVVAGGPGHGCGHNLLGSAAALAAVAVKEDMQARGLKGTIRFYGTPAEEGGGGKIYMLHSGLFKDVDLALTWHPGTANRVSLKSSMANNGAVFRFRGVAAHAAGSPELGRSALDGAMVMLNAVEFLREHVPQETRIHYVISDGGTAPNIVPALAEVKLIARHPDAPTLGGIWDRIMKCAQAGALATETRLETEQSTNYANLLPNEALATVAARAMRRAGGYQYTPEEQSFAESLQRTLSNAAGPGPEQVVVENDEGAEAYSTDVGDVSWNVPTLQIGAATYPAGTPAHSWQAAACSGSSIGRKGMLVAARTLALTAVDLMEHPAERDAAATSFAKRRGTKSWTTRIPADSHPKVGGSQ